MNIQVSVIIPYYNLGRYIEETINSVLSQTIESFEIIIVNDGSDDYYSLEILNKINHSKIKILNINNSGVSIARNKGTELANGKYLLFLDADDKIAPKYLQKAVEILEQNNDIHLINPDTEFFGAKKGKYVLPEYSLELLIKENMLVVSNVIRTADFKDSGGFDVTMKTGLEDWEFWITFLKGGRNVYHLKEIGLYYRIRSNSRNRSFSENDERDLLLKIYLKHKELYEKYYLESLKMFETHRIINSKEYKFGKILLSPLRKLLSIINKND